MLQDLIPEHNRTVDLAQGQLVVIAARWVLVVAGLLLALWDPQGMGVLRVQIVLILGLAVSNFFLQGQYLKKRPVLTDILYGASAADIAVISAIVMAQGGFESHVYVFYFPALLAISVAFPPFVTLGFAASAMGAYGLISTATITAGDEVTLVARLIMMAAVAMCGAVYQNVQQKRWGVAEETQTATPEAVVDSRSDINGQSDEETPRESILFQTAEGV